MTLHDIPEDTRIEFAQMINDQDLPWKANAYTQLDSESMHGQRQEFGFAQVRAPGMLS
jgi:hypothetical protein